MKRRVGTLIAVAAATTAVVAPGSAGAAVTLGSDLTKTPFGALPCSDATCTFAQTALPGRQLTSPIDGVVVSWRMKAQPSASGTVRIKVIRNAGGIPYTGVSTSPDIPIAATGTPTTYVFGASQPITAGDQVALDVDGGVFSNNLNITPTPAPAGSVFERWNSSLSDGVTRGSDFGAAGELLFNAEIESDCDRDGLGDETQDGDVSSCNGAPPGTDTVPPDTAISARPKDKTRKKTATFAFGGIDSGPIAGFQCSLDGGTFTTCTSTHTVKVKKGKHTFAVRAIDQAGNIDPSPATDDWKVKKKKRK